MWPSSPLCAYWCLCPNSSLFISHIRVGPPQWTHFNLITLVKSLFPNKITFPSIGGWTSTCPIGRDIIQP
jgi:GH18 family chitinase